MGLFGKKKKSNSEALRKDVQILEHEMEPEECYTKHNVDPMKGLSTAQVQALREKHGWNKLTPADVIPGWLLYIYQYTNFFSILLMAGGILCFIAYGLDKSDPSNLYLGIVLEVVVFITSTFSYVQEAKSNAIMQGFKNMVPKKCKAFRDGSSTILDAAELVPGDIVEFQEGDQVPADLRTLIAYNLKVDNSSLTGESEAQDRTVELLGGHGAGDAAPAAENHNRTGPKTPAIEASNLMFFSTIIVSGHGKGIVVGTGDNTVMGQIAGLTSESGDGDTTPPLIREINLFIKWVSIVAITLGVTFLAVGLGLGVQTVVQSLVYCISVIVATVPEGLLATLTVALALTAKRMHSRNMLVKNLQGVETLGCTTVIASDKTGTLTQNRMTVQHTWYNNTLSDVPAPRNFVQFREMFADLNEKGFHGWLKYDKDDPTFKMLQKVATICNNSDFVMSNALDPSSGLIDLAVEMQNPEFNLLGLQCTGDASESGLIKFVQVLRDVKEFRSRCPKLFEIKFNSTNKWQLGIHKDLDGPTPDKPLLLLKGAPEKVWSLCTKIMHNGKEEPLTKEWADKFEAAYEKLGSLGERVLGFAYRSMDEFACDFPFTDQPKRNFPIDGLTFAGLLSLMDPPRGGVPEAVEKCKRASIRVYMVTGDHPITAKAIAHEIGILDEHMLKSGRGAVGTGDDLRNVLDIEDEVKRTAAWDKILDHEQIVFARVTPAHKLLIVENNQRHKHIVAVTGDGVNDAPALKRANIGVSMGIAGKDVSKEAADMILMDDNFASIVNGVEEGRLIFANLKKSIMYTLTSKPPELIPFILWVAANFPLAISTILILAVDLGTDMLPAIALAYETRENNIMECPPRKVGRDYLVDVPLLLFTYLHFGVLQALAGFFAFIIALNDYGYPPEVLLGRGLGWNDNPMICIDEDGDGKVDDCGFACGGMPGREGRITELMTLYPNAGITNTQFCGKGCFRPRNTSTFDPFVEWSGQFFRGFDAGTEAACARTCSWYTGLAAETKAMYVEASSSATSPLRYILTPEDVTAFDSYCDPARHPNNNLYGFPGRGISTDGVKAPTGGSWYWDARFQEVPDSDTQKYILSAAQTAYFVTVVLCKCMNVIVTKTRQLSIFQHGMRNNRFLLVALLCMVSLAVAIAYIPPLQIVFTTQPIYGGHWALAIPWMLLLFCYDELRKLIIRSFPGSFITKVLYY